VRTTKDSFDFGFEGDVVVREGLPFLVDGMTRFTKGVVPPVFMA
jgi:hypothetical protein